MDRELVEPHVAQRRGRVSLRSALVAALAFGVCACGSGSDESPPPQRFVVLSAFPAELAAVLEHATVDDTMMVANRMFRLGRIAGVPVVIGMTGIGLVNAATTTQAVLKQFDVAGVVFSGVAGSMLQIGDVAVPMAWALKDGTTFPVHQPWIDLAGQIAASGTVTLERCTVVVTAPSNPPVCMLQQPVIVVGGVGRSTDPFNAKPFPCQPTGDIYGCDVPLAGAASLAGGDRPEEAAVASAADVPVVDDMETAAVAREAAVRGLPFIAFRAVSDGGGDPLALGGFFAQFSAYYRFAAHNAAAATTAFFERLAATR